MSDQLESLTIPSYSIKPKTLTDSPVKSPSAFKTISEVSVETGVPQHVLRFWESKFSQLRPMKRGGGRRYYRPEDMVLLQRIRRLLQDEGYTIKGVQKVLKERLDAPAIATAASNVAAARTPLPAMPRPAETAFPRTRAALSGEALAPSRLVLDVELLGTRSGRERLLHDVLDELRDLRSTLKMV